MSGSADRSPGRWLALVLCLALLGGFALTATSAGAAPVVLRQKDVVAGDTVTAWSAQWAAWLYERSGLRHDPIRPFGEGASTFSTVWTPSMNLDPQLCQKGQLPGAPMFFVTPARLFAPYVIKGINCTVPAGMPVFVTPLFCISNKAPAFEACGGGERAKVLGTGQPRASRITAVTVSVDGVPVPVKPGDLVVKRGFRLKGKRSLIAAYSFVVTGLDPGVHVIDLFARKGPSASKLDQDRAKMIATVTVQ